MFEEAIASLIEIDMNKTIYRASTSGKPNLKGNPYIYLSQRYLVGALTFTVIWLGMYIRQAGSPLLPYYIILD